MKKIVKLLTLPVMVVSLFAFASCEKLIDDASETSESGEDYAHDQTAISALVDMVQDLGETQGFMMKNGNSIIPASVPINYIDTIYTDGDGIEIEVDFPSPGVLCNDGWTRQGKVSVRTNEKRYSETGANIVLKIPSGTLSMTKEGETFSFTMMSTDHITVSRTGTNAFKVDYIFELEASYPDGQGGTVTASSNPNGSFTATQTAGADVPGTADDEFVIQGTTNGTNHNGTNYTVTITEDLVRKVDPACSKTFIKGKLELKNEGSSTSLKLEFGDGTCDNDIVIVLPGNIKQTYTVK